MPEFFVSCVFSFFQYSVYCNTDFVLLKSQVCLFRGFSPLKMAVPLWYDIKEIRPLQLNGYNKPLLRVSCWFDSGQGCQRKETGNHCSVSRFFHSIIHSVSFSFRISSSRRDTPAFSQILWTWRLTVCSEIAMISAGSNNLLALVMLTPLLSHSRFVIRVF